MSVTRRQPDGTREVYVTAMFLTDFTSFMVLLGVVATAFLSALRAVSGF